MKKIVGIVIYIIFIIFLFNIKSFQTEEQVTYYSNVTSEDLKNIEIDASNVEIEILTSPFDEIAVTRTTANQKSKEVSYGSNYVDNTLIIKQYKNQQTSSNLKDKISIQVPEKTKLDILNINLNDGEVKLNEIMASNAQIKSDTNLKLLIEGSSFNDLNISSISIESLIKNTVIENDTLYDVTGGSIGDVNVTGKNEIIDNSAPLTYYNEASFFKTTEFLKKDVKISFKLSKNKNYYFTNVQNKLNEKFLEEDGTDYKYMKDTESIKKYTIKVNENKIISIEENDQKEEES